MIQEELNLVNLGPLNLLKADFMMDFSPPDSLMINIHREEELFRKDDSRFCGKKSYDFADA